MAQHLKDLRAMLQRGELPPGLVGDSIEMRRAARMALWYAANGRNLAIFGEVGTGKTHLARWIASIVRPSEPFVEKSLASITDEMATGELCGYEAGMVSGGARGGKMGLFGQPGCLFLDEVGSAPDGVQARILTAIQDGIFCRIGGNRNMDVAPLIICATWERSRLRRDLGERLDRISVTLPPLRQRRDDIPALAQAALERDLYSGLTLAPGAAAALMQPDWPGNIRQLHGAIEAAADRVLLDNRHTITAGVMSEAISAATQPEAEALAVRPPEPTPIDNMRWLQAYYLTRRYGYFKRTQYEEACGCHMRTALGDLSAMQKKDVIVRRGHYYAWVAPMPRVAMVSQ